MLFNSIDYFLFLGITLGVFYLFPVKRRWVVLLLASVYFYACTSVYFLLTIFGIIQVSYWGGKYITKKQIKRGINVSYIILVVIILLPLLFFKYSGFIADNILFLFRYSSNIGEKNILNILVPLGISYYTFQALSYIIDVRYGMKNEENIWKFSLYLAFFPKLLMGPIERARKLLPQFNKNLYFSEKAFTGGLKLILFGLFKKLVVADRISIYTSAVFENYQHHDGITLLVASLFYTFQLYADFSGYTDIALGSAKLFGIEITDNFNRPFFATSMTEFWRRWHITLTKWLTDYVFTSIVLKWRYWGKWGVMLAGLITFFIIGIWHGAGWGFAVFGILNGFAFAFEIYTQKIRKRIAAILPQPLYNLIFNTLTFLYFSFTLIFLNAGNIPKGLNILSSILTLSGDLKTLNLSTFTYSLLGIAFIIVYEFLREYYDVDFIFHPYKYKISRYLSYSIIIIIILLIGVFDGGNFIYFKY